MQRNGEERETDRQTDRQREGGEGPGRVHTYVELFLTSHPIRQVYQYTYCREMEERERERESGGGGLGKGGGEGESSYFCWFFTSHPIRQVYLNAERLGQAPPGLEGYCHNMMVIGSILGRIEFSVLLPKSYSNLK